MPAKKEKKPVTFARTCCGVSLAARERQKAVEGVLVLGRPSAPYTTLCQVVQEALQRLGQAPAVCDDDPARLDAYGIISPPAVICNGRLVFCGQDGSESDMDEILKTALAVGEES